MMADKWNDEHFAPVTASQPDWHPHYADSVTITHKMVLDYLPPNAEKVKEQFESMMTVLKRTIPNGNSAVKVKVATMQMMTMLRIH